MTRSRKKEIGMWKRCGMWKVVTSIACVVVVTTREGCWSKCASVLWGLMTHEGCLQRFCNGAMIACIQDEVLSS